MRTTFGRSRTFAFIAKVFPFSRPWIITPKISIKFTNSPIPSTLIMLKSLNIVFFFPSNKLNYQINKYNHHIRQSYVLILEKTVLHSTRQLICQLDNEVQIVSIIIETKDLTYIIHVIIMMITNSNATKHVQFLIMNVTTVPSP